MAGRRLCTLSLSSFVNSPRSFSLLEILRVRSIRSDAPYPSRESLKRFSFDWAKASSRSTVSAPNQLRTTPCGGILLKLSIDIREAYRSVRSLYLRVRIDAPPSGQVRAGLSQRRSAKHAPSTCPTPLLTANHAMPSTSASGLQS